MNALRKIAFSVVILLPSVSSACLWVGGTTLDGSLRMVGGLSHASKLRVAMKADLELKLAQFPAKSPGDENAKEIEAVRAILKGEPNLGIPILLEVEGDSPGQYTVAANLGTAYELAGNDREALRWIEEGIKRNKDSHEGTEWLHKLILETKLRLKSDPDYLKHHHVLSLPNKFGKDSIVTVGGAQRSISDIANALYYQLSERMFFVKPPDPIVADLLFTFALIEARTEVVEAALKLLDLSKEYGFSSQELLDETAKKFEFAILLGKIKFYSVLVLGILVAVWALYFCYRKKWFFLTSAAYKRHLREKAGFPKIS